MRISVVNFCSTAVDMLDFSSKMLRENAGMGEFDYFVTTWNPTPDVEEWLACRPEIGRIIYETDPARAYVPNLRMMMCHGWSVGYQHNDWVAVVNTDMAFGRNWLANLARRATEGVIPNSLHLSPIKGSNIVTVDLGVPTEKTFDTAGFWRIHDRLYADKIETEDDRGGWRATQTFPYIVHRKWWESFGPWEPEVGDHRHPPDYRYFERIHEAGARYVMVHDSICYHHEAVERRSKRRPVGLENMPEGR